MKVAIALFVLPGIPSESHLQIVDIASGLNATYALTSTGDVYEWGSLRRANNFVRKRREQWLTPHLVFLPPGVKAHKLFAGGYHAFIVTKNGDLYGWGLNTKAQLGLGDDLTNHERPVRIPRMASMFHIPRGLLVLIQL